MFKHAFRYFIFALTLVVPAASFRTASAQSPQSSNTIIPITQNGVGGTDPVPIDPRDGTGLSPAGVGGSDPEPIDPGGHLHSVDGSILDVPTMYNMS